MGKKIIAPTRAQDKQINRGIADDPDTFEATAKDFRQAKSAREVLPSKVYESLRLARQRGPQKSPKKIPVSLRVDQDILNAYAATGRGYQSRMNEALRLGAKSLKDQL